MTLPIPAGTYGIDRVHSQFGFAVEMLGISVVRGTFAEYTGELSIGERVEDSAVWVQAEMATVSSGNTRRDDVLHGPDWFDVDTHPHLTFRSTSVAEAGDGYVMTGELGIRDATRPVSLSVTYNGEAYFPMDRSTHFGFSATGRIQRSAFGVSSAIGIVSDEVDLLLEAQFVRPPDT